MAVLRRLYASRFSPLLAEQQHFYEQDWTPAAIRNWQLARFNVEWLTNGKDCFSTAERVNADLKDNYGGGSVRVKGHEKVFAHLMFGIIAITAKQLFNMMC